MFKYIIILVVNISIFQTAQSICGQCNANNGIACISQTEFQLCFDGKPNTETTYQCLNPNEICSKLPDVCIDSASGMLPACGDTSNCGRCENLNNGAFTCTSRTTFTMCSGNQLTDIRISCPENQMCDVAIAAEGTNPCVPDCKEPTIKFCDLLEAIDEPAKTTTQEPSTTTTEATTTITETTTTEEASTTTTTGIPTTTTTTETYTTTTTAIPTTTTTTEIPTTTTREIPTTTTTTEIPTTTTTTEIPTTTTTTEIPTTTTTEIPTTTVIFSPTPPTTTTVTTELPTTTTATFNPTPPTTTTTTTELPPPTTTTIITTTTDATTESPANILCSQQTAVGRYPYPNDATCRKYVYCFVKAGAMQTAIYDCPAELYFNSATSSCVQPKPEGCS